MAVSTKQADSTLKNPSATQATPARDQTLAAIAHVVAMDIVPRLLAAQQARLRGEASSTQASASTDTRSTGTGKTPDAAPANAGATNASPDPRASAPDATFISRLTDELIAGDIAAVKQRIELLSHGGLTAEQLCLLALAPAARHLGDLWNMDRCSFLEVTTGTAMLHGIMNELRLAFRNRVFAGVRRRSAVLVTAPGEQHRFGLSMLAEFFRKDGWQVALPTGTTIAQITAVTAGRPVDLVGFSAGSDRHLGGLAACIAALRASSYNPDIIVMVGGPIFLERPELVESIGADATAADAEDAVLRAQVLLKTRRAAISRRMARVGTQSSQHTTRAAACDRGASYAP